MLFLLLFVRLFCWNSVKEKLNPPLFLFIVYRHKITSSARCFT